LKLITSNFDVNEMVQAYLGLPIVELYINSFSESIPDIDEGNDEDNNDNDNDNDDDERGYSRIERDDPYWEEVNEPDLFVDNDDVPGPSMWRGGIREVGDIDEEGREESDGGVEGEESDESDEGEEEGDEDEGRLRVDHSNSGSNYDEDANSDMPRSDILTSPPRSDDEYEVTSQSQRRHVTEPSEFQTAESVQPHSQSQPQPQTNAFVSPQSTIILYLLLYVSFGIT